MALNDELQRLYKQLDQLNYKRVRSRNGHWKIYTPDGRFVATGVGKNGDPRSVKNLRSELRRAGAAV